MHKSGPAARGQSSAFSCVSAFSHTWSQAACLVYKFLYIRAMDEGRGEPKEIDFVDTALDDLRAFPEDARRDRGTSSTGYQLDKVQHAEEPDDWKPFPTVGPGTREIRISEDGDAFRVMYVTKFADMIHVLHCFQKKTRATPRKDIDLAKKRYASLKREFGR